MFVGAQTRLRLVVITLFVAILCASAKPTGRLSNLNQLPNTKRNRAVKRYFTTYLGLLERCDIKNAITNYAADARLYNRDGQIRTRDDVEATLTAFCQLFTTSTFGIDTIEQVDSRTYLVIVRVEFPGKGQKPIVSSYAIRFRFTHNRGELRAQALRVLSTSPTGMGS